MGIFQVELYNGEDPVDSGELTTEDLTMEQAVYGVNAAFDKGIADRSAIYVTSEEGELLGIVARSKGEFDVKDVAVEINQMLQGE